MKTNKYSVCTSIGSFCLVNATSFSFERGIANFYSGSELVAVFANPISIEIKKETASGKVKK